ncbi:MAG TPA: PAS domain S-box protein [Gemmatimonadaceae bacterium]|nr:PAS domain S-box protein [Gemmatimonadaceae bacterium]
MSETPRLIPLIRRLASNAIAALVVLALTVALMTYLTWQSSQWVKHTRQVQFAGARALDLALDRQASIAGFLVTGDSTLLALERRARPALQRELDTLTTLTIDNQQQQQQLGLIDEAVRGWDSSYANPILQSRDVAERARIGREQRSGATAFAIIRSRIESLLEEEASLYTKRAQRNTLWRWGEVVVVGIEAIVVLVVLLRLRGELLTRAAQLVEQQAQLEEQAIELEAQAAEQEMLTADLEIANQELTEAAVEAEEARDAALALEERFRMLFDFNPAPMWVYDEETRRFLNVNRAAVQQYGYSAEEFVQMTIEDIRLPEDVPLLRSLARLPDSELRESPGWRHRRKDGSLICVDIFTHGVEFEGRRARIVIAMDVTAREEAEAALNASTGILRAVVDDSPLAIVISTPDLIINRWNKAATLQFGWSAEDAIGRSVLDLIPDEKRQEFCELRSRLEAGEVITNFETQRRRSDGLIRDVHMSQCALHDKLGAPTGFVGIYSDETQRKQLEAQYRQAQKMEAVGQLAGGVAHDFNNLLTVIISYSQMLLADMAESSASRADVHEIKRAAERAALLTKQLLAFSRQQVLRPQILDLNVVIGDLEQMLRRLLREDISIVLSLDAELGTVAADPGQVEQIVMNLVVNARDAMPNGGRLAIETSNVEFESQYQLRASEPPLEAGSYVMIAVSDNGTGMTSDVQSRVFEPFYTTKRLNEGTGLGLSTVYGIVKQSGGHLAMYSEVGHGTIFKIYLPRADAIPDIQHVEESAAEVSTLGGETILIVEDDDALRIVACRALVQRGYDVLEASDGQEALRVCAQHDGRIHLVVSDMVMPEMSGSELAELIAESFPEVRVLLMSGYTRDEAARRGIASERYSFLEKPFTPTKLAARVRELLDHARPRAPGLQSA